MLPHEHGEGKIQGWHRDRLAVIYVRQSSRQQVLDHGESTRDDILGLLSMLLERWAVSVGLAAEETGGEHGASA